MYAFSGDPITYGHIDIIQRAAAIFDEVIVGIGTNPDKRYLFTLEERTEMARRSLVLLPNVTVISFQGLLVDYAFEYRIPVIIKGVRDEKDLADEEVLHYAGQSQKLGIDTFLLPATPEKAHIRSSVVKALQKEHGEIHHSVPLYVKQCLEAKLSGQSIVGITGEIGVGKSHVSKALIELGKRQHIPVHHIELDDIGHAILGTLPEPVYRSVRHKVVKEFGDSIELPDGSINRKALGDIVFSNLGYLKKLNDLLHPLLLVRLRRELYAKQGLILVNAALFAETETLYLCNNHMILVTADKKSQERRLREKQFEDKQIERRLACQYSTEEKKRAIEQRIAADRQGKLWIAENSDGVCDYEQLFTDVIRELRCIGK